MGCTEGSLGKWLCSIGHSSFYVVTAGTVLPLHGGWMSSLGRAPAQVGYGLGAGQTQDSLRGFVGRTMLHFWLFAASGPRSLSGLQILRSESLRGLAQTRVCSQTNQLLLERPLGMQSLWGPPWLFLGKGPISQGHLGSVQGPPPCAGVPCSLPSQHNCLCPPPTTGFCRALVLLLPVSPRPNLSLADNGCRAGLAAEQIEGLSENHKSQRPIIFLSCVPIRFKSWQGVL